jgi:hypothetical protein
MKSTSIKKPRTNRETLTKLIKDLDDSDLVFVRERLLTMAQLVVNNEEEIRKEMSVNPLISADWYIRSMKKIHSSLKFDE